MTEQALLDKANGVLTMAFQIAAQRDCSVEQATWAIDAAIKLVEIEKAEQGIDLNRIREATQYLLAHRAKTRLSTASPTQ